MAKQHHSQRITKDPEFAYIFEDIDQYQREKDNKTISLVESERIKKKEERESKRLARANERLLRAGREVVKSLDDLPEDFDEIDPFLDEAANITYDIVSTGKYAANNE